MIHERQLRRFTLTDMLVALVLLGIAAALLLPAVQAAREAANANVCANTLRQLSLANMNHQDQRGDGLPMGMFSGGISWAGLMTPYIENYTFYRRLRFDQLYNAVPNNDVRHLKDPLYASQPYLYCLSRRKAPQLTDGYASSDYAVPSVGANETLDDPALDDTWMQCHALDKNHGPMLLVSRNQPEGWPAGESFRKAMQYPLADFAGFVQRRFGVSDSLGRKGAAF